MAAAMQASQHTCMTAAATRQEQKIAIMAEAQLSKCYVSADKFSSCTSVWRMSTENGARHHTQQNEKSELEKTPAIDLH